MKRKRFELSPSSPAAVAGELVSIVVPARNEENNIRNCLISALQQDYEDIEVIVFDDGSSDHTPDILSALSEEYPQLNVQKGDGSPLPAGWFGKPWALERAQRVASGKWIVFVDADVCLAPQAISRCLAYARHHNLEMVTGLGDLTMKTFWEKVLQPAIGGLILAGNSLSKVNDHERKEHNLANGQFIMISRNAYNTIGRHACVQADILDDIGMARALAKHNQPYHCLHLQDLFSCRMYTSFSEIWEGGPKICLLVCDILGKILMTILFTYSFFFTGDYVSFSLCTGLD